MIMIYGIIFWGNSSNSDKIFLLHKVIRIKAGAQKRESHRKLFKKDLWNVNKL
jgi:hypothetical protein